MKKSVLIIVFFLLSIAAVTAQNQEQITKKPKLEPAPELMNLFLDAVQGKDIPELKKKFSPEVYAVYNNTYESIFEVLNNQSKREIFFTNKEVKTGFVMIKTSEDEKTAYMVVEIKSTESGKSTWHSLLFELSENNKWQIFSWHKS